MKIYKLSITIHANALITLCVIAMLAATGASAQTVPHGRIEGTVTNTEGKPVETAYVVLNGSLYTLTDKNGHYAISNVPAGEISYYVSCLGYKEKRGVTKTKGDGSDRLDIQLTPLDLSIGTVVVTAQQQAMGSKSIIDQNAVRHIQPKSLADMLQLLPGSLTKNPTLNDLAQANIREIDGNDNNALGTAVILDGTPISNDANMQALAPTMLGNSSSSTLDGMSDQTTAGRGSDLRTVSADNIESVEVIRGIPSVEYGNLTSGVVLVKTKAGRSPVEAKLKADPFSKLVYAGKGFSLGNGTMNLGIDWSQSYSDTRRHYLGYDRITATAAYSTVFGAKGAHPVTFNVNGSFYNNVNKRKRDRQMDELQLTYRNKNTGGRLAIHGHAQIDRKWLTGIDYDLSGQVSRTLDTHHDYISSPDGVISGSMETGEHTAMILNKAYFSDYRLEGIPINVFAQVKGNKYFQINDHDYTNIKAGLEYRLDDNNGDGLTFDLTAPPKAGQAQSYRPRALKDIPALYSLSAFFSDVSSFGIGKTRLQFDAGVRLSNLFLNKDKAKRNDIFVAEPRINAEYTILNKNNNSIFDKLSISGGFGISNKMPTLLYLYPDKAYFDNVSVSAIGSDGSRIAAMTTNVVDNTQNPNLKPARSTKWEIGLNATIGKMKGYINFFSERHRNEFGYNSQFILLNYNKYSVPAGATNLAYTGNSVTYDLDGTSGTATVSQGNELQLWNRPGNTQRTDKHGIEYSWDFGTFAPLRTSLVLDGAWFHIKRQSAVNRLNYISYQYDYIPMLPAGSGTVSDRVNTNFRFITHIPAVNLVFTTTVQVVWYENERSIYETKSGKKLYHLSSDGTRYLVSPIGFYDRQGKWNEWQESYENMSQYYLMNGQYMVYAFKSDHIDPWALVNFRLTKELGKIAEISFMANNFLNLKRYHTDRNYGYKTQLYPDMYFGAELKMKF